MLVFAAGEDEDGNSLSNPVGTGIRLQEHYPKLREMIKGKLNCVVGPLLSNKIICFAPTADSVMDYGERSAVIERCAELRRDLNEKTGVHFRIAIGGNEQILSLPSSYTQALQAL